MPFKKHKKVSMYKPDMDHGPDMDHKGPGKMHGPDAYDNKPESNKFIGELTKARKAGKKTFEVNGKEYKVRMSGGGPHPNNMGYAEKYSASNFSDKTMKMMDQAPAYKPTDNHDAKKKRTNSAIEAAIKQKKTGKTDPSILRVIGDPEEMKKDLARLDSMQANFKKTKDSMIAKSKMSSKDRVKSLRDKYKDFFNN